MKVLVAGDWHSELHEEVMANSLRAMGHSVCEFRWHRYFQIQVGRGAVVSNLWRRFQNKYLVGPALTRLNRDFLFACRDEVPDLVFVYRGTHIQGKTLRRARSLLPGCIFVGYNNDDPFGPEQPGYLWRHFLNALPEFDLVLAYRHVNIKEYLRAGARRVELLRSWYVASRNHPVEMTPEQSREFGTDVVFVGHYEPDGRLDYLEQIVKQGIAFKLFGPGYDWNPVLENSTPLCGHIPVRLVWGAEYNLALAGAKIALCFLSKLNRDTYTRRCFEIPATGTLLLSEYSEDLADLFEEGIEADYFRSPEEMIRKIMIYLGDDSLRQRVASAGRARVLRDGHDVDSRMRQMLAWVDSIASEKSHRGPEGHPMTETINV